MQKEVKRGKVYSYAPLEVSLFFGCSERATVFEVSLRRWFVIAFFFAPVNPFVPAGRLVFAALFHSATKFCCRRIRNPKHRPHLETVTGPRNTGFARRLVNADSRRSRDSRFGPHAPWRR